MILSKMIDQQTLLCLPERAIVLTDCSTEQGQRIDQPFYRVS